MVTIDAIEELPRLNVSLHPEVLDFPEGGPATNRVAFLKVLVDSEKLGCIQTHVLYAFAENEAFAGEVLVPAAASLSHVIHVRYGGGGGGGGNASGSWLKSVLTKFGTEVFINDGHWFEQNGDQFVRSRYPAMFEGGTEASFLRIRELPSASWSDHGNVSWELVKPIKPKAS